MELGDILKLLFGVLATMLGAIAIVIAWSASKSQCASLHDLCFSNWYAAADSSSARIYDNGCLDTLPMYHPSAPTTSTPRFSMRRATLLVEEA